MAEPTPRRPAHTHTHAHTHTLQEAKALLLALPTELLREAMEGARGGGGARALATLQSAITTAEGAEGVEEEVIQEAKTLLATQPLRTAMAGVRGMGSEAPRGGSGYGGGGGFGLGGGFGAAPRADPLARLQSAIATAKGAEGVDVGVIQEAKTLLATLLATQSLRTAMARREAAGLRAAIQAVDRQAEVDPAVVEVVSLIHL